MGDSAGAGVSTCEEIGICNAARADDSKLCAEGLVSRLLQAEAEQQTDLPMQEQSQQGHLLDGANQASFLLQVEVAEQMRGGKGVVDVEPLKYHSAAGIIVQRGATRGPALDSGSGVSIVGDAESSKMVKRY